MALTLTITREIQPAQVVDLCDLLRGSHSSWLVATESDLDTATISITHYTDLETTAGEVTETVTFQEILDALAALYAEGQLCCAAAMIDDLGAGCADDADRIFHRATFGAHRQLDMEQHHAHHQDRLVPDDCDYRHWHRTIAAHPLP